MKRTFSIIKPDATKRNITGAINKIIEENNLNIVGQKRIKLSREQAEGFYSIHKDKQFFRDLVDYMTSGPVQVQVLQGESAIDSNRKIMGATNPSEAAAGSIRADFADSIEENIVHGSDGPETAAQEIKFFFNNDEICKRTRK